MRVFEVLRKQLKRVVEIVSADFEFTDAEVIDSKDHPILLTAREARADYIITGDRDLLELEEWRGVRIVGMSEFEMG